MRRWPFLAGALLLAHSASARPPGPGVICDVWPDSAACDGGQPGCDACHTTPPARDAFGQAIEAVLLPDEARPLDDAAFAAGLPAALAMVADEDSDGDGFTNVAEFAAGSDASDASSMPGQMAARCDRSINPRWNVCGYDARYVFKRLHLDVCGQQPSYEAFTAFGQLSAEQQDAALREALAACTSTPFWMGRDGVLWRMAHKKVRPLQAIKSGRAGGPVPLGDYDHDYQLFVYTQTGDRDARDVLLADYHVQIDEGSDPPTYTRVNALPGQLATPDRRAGMLTTRWFFVINTMFTPLPRTAAAQAYRGYLGLDIAKSEGLYPAQEPIIDYDDKGINAPACAACHDTLDPLTYPFSRYWGIAGGHSGRYDPDRLGRFGPADGSRLDEVPEAGYLMGQRVDDLVEWAQVAAASDAFARATVREYWTLLVGHAPTPAEEAEYDALWRAFKGEHEYRVERMLQALIRTEAYGVP